MLNELYNKIKSIIVRESVSELIPEVPGIPLEDQELLYKAIADGIIPNEFPSYSDMMDELSKLTQAHRISFSDIGPKDKIADKADVQGAYLKSILLPIAKGERPSRPQVVRIKSLSTQQKQALEGILSELLAEYVYLMKDNEGTIVPIVTWARDVSRELADDIKSGDLLLDEEEEETVSLLFRIPERELERYIYMVATSGYEELKQLL